MNTIFDFKRFGLLIKRHFFEKFQAELMFWGLSIICMMFIRNTLPAFFCFVIISCLVRSGQFFREIHSATNRINYFMIPATQIEKFVVSLLHTVVYFWIMMFLVYVIGNISGTWIHNLLANISFIPALFGFEHSNLSWVVFDSFKNIENNILFAILIMILIIQSLFLLGGIYFKKNQVIKTFLVLVIIGVFLGIVGQLETANFLSPGLQAHAIKGAESTINITQSPLVKFAKTMSEIFYYLLLPYLWFTCYIRLTEKEV